MPETIGDFSGWAVCERVASRPPPTCCPRGYGGGVQAIPPMIGKRDEHLSTLPHATSIEIVCTSGSTEPRRVDFVLPLPGFQPSKRLGHFLPGGKHRGLHIQATFDQAD